MKMELETQERTDAGMARAVAAEDLRAGDYIYVLGELLEMVPLLIDAERWQNPESVKLMVLPHSGLEPMKIVEVCLPVLLVKDKSGKCETLDARLFRFARLPDRFGRKVFKRLRKSAEKQSGSDTGSTA
jgi:hypothetical protein